jgi:hypothetical protein
MAYQSPTFFGVAYATRLFCEIEAARPLVALRKEIGLIPNLRRPGHAIAILRWLNKWGCRITKEAFDTIADRLTEWFEGRWQGLPRSQLQELLDRELDVLAHAYEELLRINEFGPTAASKALFVLCPNAAIPWDAAIQQAFELPGGTPGQYRSMLVRSGQEAAALIADAARCGVSDHRAIPRAASSQAETLPELLDEYHWVTITRRHTVPDGAELKQWAAWVCREVVA